MHNCTTGVRVKCQRVVCAGIFTLTLFDLEWSDTWAKRCGEIFQMDIKVRVLVAVSSLVTIAMFIFVPAMEQPLSYHDFADANRRLGIPNFGNVISNLAYLIPGVLGLNFLHERHNDSGLFLEHGEALLYYAVFLGAVFVAFGSGYYHLNPINETLVADRMTMTVGFMGVFCVIIAERISVRWGLKLLPPLLVVGLFSVIYWIYTELQSAGDLRLYGLVQFLPLLTIAVMLLSVSVSSGV